VGDLALPRAKDGLAPDRRLRICSRPRLPRRGWDGDHTIGLDMPCGPGGPTSVTVRANSAAASAGTEESEGWGSTLQPQTRHGRGHVSRRLRTSLLALCSPRMQRVRLRPPALGKSPRAIGAGSSRPTNASRQSLSRQPALPAPAAEGLARCPRRSCSQDEAAPRPRPIQAWRCKASGRGVSSRRVHLFAVCGHSG